MTISSDKSKEYSKIDPWYDTERWLNNPIFVHGPPIFLIFIVLLTIFFVLFFVGAYAVTSGGFDFETRNWISFSNIFNLVAQGVMGLATIAAALTVSVLVSGGIEKRNKKNEQHRELIRLSEKMVDPEFYIKILYPAWEVAQKWFRDKDYDYKAKVVLGETRLPKFYVHIKDDTGIAANHVRDHPHFTPYDVRHKQNERAPVLNEMSESLAFATWIRFWQHIAFLVEKDILERGDVKAMFREWYMWWAPFMTQFAAVVKGVLKELRDDGRLALNKSQYETYISSLAVQKIENLHVIMEICPYIGYKNKIEFEGVIKQIVDAILNRIGDLEPGDTGLFQYCTSSSRCRKGEP
ncbi:hypothetical protein [Sphingomonas colocasiae]|uniref:Uncharacterized protein n=1 Tax=Sphingomonas colocasiae TaxID=1848973 RepID=A0ABS7PWB4_9SPHN|nr:hypothetical protein [Sphingomonas colocasiae]MBY8824279.1 hypothetical protein [Sphingomonas colocasiae]